MPVITRYCMIRNQHIICDGKILFSDKNSSLNDFLLSAYTSLGIEYPKFYKMDALSKLGFLGAEVLLKSRDLTKEYAPENISLILSNAHASLDTDLKYSDASKHVSSPALFVYTLSNIVTGEICIRHKIKGENAFFVTEEFDAELITGYVNMVLSTDAALPLPDALIPNALIPNALIPNACISGWVDVLSGHHDVFLYLCEKNKPGLWPHTAEQVSELYNTVLWNN
jgi:hypothetical protein